MSDEVKKTTVIVKRRFVAATTQSTEAATREKIKANIENYLKFIATSATPSVVTYEVMESTTRFLIDVAQGDYGRLLGSKGKNINALRVLVGAMGATFGVRAVVTIKDEEKHTKASSIRGSSS